MIRLQPWISYNRAGHEGGTVTKAARRHEGGTVTKAARRYEGGTVTKPSRCHEGGIVTKPGSYEGESVIKERYEGFYLDHTITSSLIEIKGEFVSS